MGVVNRIISLKGRKLFEEIFTKGKRINQKELQLIILKKRGTGERPDIRGINHRGIQSPAEIKIGIPINRKYGNSVSRNKAKRRIREMCREMLKEVDQSYFLIIRPREEFKNLDYESGKKVVERVFETAGVLRP